MIASCGGHVNIVRLLLEAKAQVNTQEKVCSYTWHYTICTRIPFLLWGYAIVGSFSFLLCTYCT